MAATVSAGIAGRATANTEVDAGTAFSLLKALVGDWEIESSRRKAHSRFELIAGGSVLLEHFTEPGGQEMLTAHHLDGSRLLSSGGFRVSVPKPKDHTVNLIPRGVAVFRWSDADAGGPEEVVKSESTSDNPEKKEKRGMQFLLLIYENEERFASGFDPGEMQDYQTFRQQHASAIKGGSALHPTTEAKTVRVRNGKALTTDGPFAETKEQLGGFYLVEAPDKAAAAAMAAKIPGARFGCVEVRPIMTFS